MWGNDDDDMDFDGGVGTYVCAYILYNVVTTGSGGCLSYVDT